MKKKKDPFKKIRQRDRTQPFIYKWTTADLPRAWFEKNKVPAVKGRKELTAIRVNLKKFHDLLVDQIKNPGKYHRRNFRVNMEMFRFYSQKLRYFS